jgi:pimeloyl-ACP methyl ester carboxylesterase
MGAESGGRRGAIVAGDVGWSGQDWLTWKQVAVLGRPACYGEGGSGPPVVFLHGWGLDHKAYKRALGRLVRNGVHVLAPALPGFGGTAGLPHGAQNLAGYADWVAAFLRTVGLDEPAVVMGHSFGGGVAVMVAHDHPDLADSLVLVDSIGGATWWQSQSNLRTVARRAPWAWEFHPQAPVREATRLLPDIMGGALANLVRDPLTFVRVAGLAGRAALGAELDALRNRGLPAAVLWGQRDRVINRESFEATCRSLGQPAVVTHPGNHTWLLTDPDSFGTIMAEVLDALRVTGVPQAVAFSA